MPRSSKKLMLAALAVLILGVGAGAAGFVVAANRSGQVSQAQESSAVKLYSDRAMPDAIAVKVGQTVEFASADKASHSLSLGGGSHGLEEGGEDHENHGGHQHLGDFSSGEFKYDEAWRATFKKAGTYNLHDHLHPGVRITVVVYVGKSSVMIK